MFYLILYTLLTLALTQTFGVYDAGYVVAIGLGYAVLVGWVAIGTFREPRAETPGQTILLKAGLTLIALLSVLHLTLIPGLVYAEQGLAFLLLRSTLAIADMVVAGLVVAEWLRQERWVTGIFWLALGLLLMARVFTVLASPSPYIDVFTLTNQASDYLLAGHNPYPQVYTDLYNGLYGYAPGPNYWPAYYLWSAPFRALGDIRWGVALADVVTVVALLNVLAKLNLNLSLRRWAALAWLAFPISLYVLEQAWIEPVMVMWMVLALWALLEKRWRLAGVLLGVAAATKQYMPLLAIMTCIVARRNLDRRNALQIVLWAGGAFAVIMLPFLADNPQAFYQQTVATYFVRGVRLDGLSIPAWLANAHGITVDTWAMLFLYVLALGLAGWAAWRAGTWGAWAAALAVAFGGVFIFGKQAFCNYYYLLSFILLAAGCLGPRPIQLYDSTADRL